MAGFVSSGRPEWPAGTRLGVFPRVADSFSNAHEAIKSTSVKADGSIKVDGLEESVPYWLADSDGNAVAFTGKDPQGKVQSPLSKAVEAFGPQSAAPGRATQPNVITGARSSADLRARHQAVLLSEERVVTDAEPQPHVNQLDAKGPQRSDTAFGEATPKDPKEVVPQPSQSDVSKGTKQRSDTELGVATPKPSDEVEPFLAQDDVKRGTRQRSDTELGQVEPKGVQGSRPSKKAALEVEKARSSAQSKAEGSTEQQSKAQTSKKNSK